VTGLNDANVSKKPIQHAKRATYDGIRDNEVHPILQQGN